MTDQTINEQATPWIVVLVPTVMDGEVLRWHRTEQQARRGDEAMSVSRKGVLVHAYLHEIPALLLTIAEDLRQALMRGRSVRHAATHVWLPLGNLTRIKQEEA